MLKFTVVNAFLMIIRSFEDKIKKRLRDNKAIIVLGPRQSGKTTFVDELIAHYKLDALVMSGDDVDDRNKLTNTSAAKLRQLIGKHKVLVIDEAQRIENIGITIKLIVDKLKDIKVITTGSSAFELANKINEPLTGRKWEYILLPFSFQEMAAHHGEIEEQKLLEQRLIYGYYPDVVNNPSDAPDILKQLANSYLYKDILTWEDLKKPDRLEKLVQALAFQVGNEVSYNELGQLCGLNNETVERYILLLEKAFVVFRLTALNRNLRNELKKSRKIYFYDNGLRNAIINNFNSLQLRNDTRALWENFLVSERLKVLYFNERSCNRYFWRTLAQQEIDYVEEKSGTMQAYEFKWSTTKKYKFPKSFVDNYTVDSTKIITKENFKEFVLP